MTPASSRRSMFALLLLAACATASADVVPPELRGCWIERRGEDTLTMRWFPGQGIEWRGDLLHYAPNVEPEPQTFLIVEQEVLGLQLCPQAEPTNPPCRSLSFTPGGEDDRAEIRVTAESLRVDWVDGADRLTLFDGQRDGCD